MRGSPSGPACAPNCPTEAWRGVPGRRGGRPPAGEPSARGNAGGPTGPPRKRSGTTWPQSMAQGPARVPPVRPTVVVRPPTRDHGESRDRPQKLVNTALGEEAALGALENFAESDPGARYPQTVATWDRAQAGSCRSQSSPPTGRRVVPAPLAREVPPPPTLLSPRAANCTRAAKNRGHYSPPTRPRLNYCGQQTRNSDERAQERDKDQGKPASKRTAHPVSSKVIPPSTAKQAPARAHHGPPDRTTPHL